MVTQLISWLPQGDKEDREKMRAMDAEKVRQEKAQRKADEALMEPARLAARGLSLEQIETDMKRRGMSYDRDYLIRQIEKADRKRAAEEDDPFYAVNTEVVHCPCLCTCWSVYIWDCWSVPESMQQTHSTCATICHTSDVH